MRFEPKKYLVIAGCSEDDVQHIIGGTDDFESACGIAKNLILSTSKFWNSGKSQDVLVTKAFVYEVAAEAVAHVEIKGVGKEVAR